MDWVNWGLGAGDGDDWAGLYSFIQEKKASMPKRKRTSSTMASTKRRRTSGIYRPRTRRSYKTAKRAYRRTGRRSYGKSINRRLNAINKSLKSDQASHIHRRRDVLQVGCNENESVFSALQSTSTALLETVMGSLRYYDPSTPGTLVTADASTGTYTRQIHFAGISDKVTVRNNYQVPVHVILYSCTPKVDTSTNVLSFMNAGISDQVVTAGVSATSPLIYPTDFKSVVANWNVVRCKTRLLQPGQEFTCSKYFKAFDYDPSNVDTHALSFQKKYRAHQWCVRLVGVLGHDSTATGETTTLQGQVDTILDRKFQITYDAGVNLDDITIDNNATAGFTNLGIVSNRPMSEQQNYSI